MILNEKKSENIETAGLKIGPDTKNNLILLARKGTALQKTNAAEDDTNLETSASPTAYGDYGAIPAPPPPPPPASTSSSGDYTYSGSIIRQDSIKNSGSSK